MAGSEEVQVILNGQEFTGWKKFSFSNDFEDVTGEASLVISEQPGNPLPARLGDECLIRVANVPVITGFVKDVSGPHEFTSHDITLGIKDKTDDLLKSTVGPDLQLKAPIDLKQVAEKTIGHMGLNISVIDKVGAAPFKQGEVVSGDISDRGHRLLDSWASKRNVILNTDGAGNLVLNQNQKQLSTYRLYKGPEGSLNNILASTYKNSEEGRSHEYNASGQKSPNDIEFWESRPKNDPLGAADVMSTNWGKAFDSAIRPELKLHFRGRRSLQGKTPEELAVRTANINRARGLTYKARVQGFTQGLGGRLWWPGYIFEVYDWHWQINHLLFLKAVAFTKDENASITELDFTVEDAFSPQAELSGDESRNKKTPIGGTQKGRFSAVPSGNDYDPDTGVRRLKGLE